MDADERDSKLNGLRRNTVSQGGEKGRRVV